MSYEEADEFFETTMADGAAARSNGDG